MDTNSVISEVIVKLQEILKELIADDCETKQNLAEIKEELDDIAQRHKAIDESVNSNIMPRGIENEPNQAN